MLIGEIHIRLRMFAGICWYLSNFQSINGDDRLYLYICIYIYDMKLLVHTTCICQLNVCTPRIGIHCIHCLQIHVSNSCWSTSWSHHKVTHISDGRMFPILLEQLSYMYIVLGLYSPQMVGPVFFCMDHHHDHHWLILTRSDLQVCAHSTGGGNLAILMKQFTRLGIKNWTELARAKRILCLSRMALVSMQSVQVANKLKM